jgi:hypothetical protein
VIEVSTISLKESEEIKSQMQTNDDDQQDKWKSRLQVMLNHISPTVHQTRKLIAQSVSKESKKKAAESVKNKTTGSDVLVQFSPLVTGQIQRSLVTYLTPHSASAESLQAGVLLVASTRADIRRQFINRLCDAAVERSALVYSIAPSGSVNVQSEGVYKLTTHPTLSRRAILSALLRHGAHLLIFGTISTRDDVMALMDAAYTGYHCVAEIYGESAHDVLSRLEAIGVDVTTLPQNLRIVVPAAATTSELVNR